MIPFFQINFYLNYYIICLKIIFSTYFHFVSRCKFEKYIYICNCCRRWTGTRMGWWRSRNFWKHVVPIQTFPRVWRHWTRPSDTRHDHDTCHGPENILSIWKYICMNRSTLYLTSWTRGERISSRCITKRRSRRERAERLDLPEVLLVREFSGSKRERSRGKKKKKRRRFFSPQLVRKRDLWKGRVAFKRSENDASVFSRMKESFFIRR